MTTTELKGKLMQKISKVNDPDFFEALKLFVDLKLEHKVYQIPKSQKLLVEEGLTQLKNGEGISDTELDQRMQGWLKEK